MPGFANIRKFLLLRYAVIIQPIAGVILILTFIVYPQHYERMNALLYLGGFYLLYMVVFARSASSLVFFPYNVTGFAFEGALPVMNIEILVQNPTNSTFTVNSIAGNAFTDDTLVGNLSSFEQVQIPPNTEVALPVRIRFQPLGIVDDIISAFKDGHIAKDVKVTGTVNANGYQLPLTVSYHLGI